MEKLVKFYVDRNRWELLLNMNVIIIFFCWTPLGNIVRGKVLKVFVGKSLTLLIVALTLSPMGGHMATLGFTGRKLKAFAALIIIWLRKFPEKITAFPCSGEKLCRFCESRSVISPNSVAAWIGTKRGRTGYFQDVLEISPWPWVGIFWFQCNV